MSKKSNFFLQLELRSSSARFFTRLDHAQSTFVFRLADFLQVFFHPWVSGIFEVIGKEAVGLVFLIITLVPIQAPVSPINISFL
jgi:hypothetical protein